MQTICGGLHIFIHSATRSKVCSKRPSCCGRRVCQQERLLDRCFDVVKKVRNIEVEMKDGPPVVVRVAGSAQLQNPW